MPVRFSAEFLYLSDYLFVYVSVSLFNTALLLWTVCPCYKVISKFTLPQNGGHGSNRQEKQDPFRFQRDFGSVFEDQTRIQFRPKHRIRIRNSALFVVLTEECDENMSGAAQSHFGMYVDAMKVHLFIHLVPEEI